jgi:hypothetical protein
VRLDDYAADLFAIENQVEQYLLQLDSVASHREKIRLKPPRRLNFPTIATTQHGSPKVVAVRMAAGS